MTPAHSKQLRLSRSGQVSARRLRLRGGLVLLVVVVLAITGGAIASYSLSQSTETESSVAIDTFDLHSDLTAIAGDLSLPKPKWTSEVTGDVISALAGARQGILELRAAGDHTRLLTRAVNASAAYVNLVEQELASNQTSSSGVVVGSAGAVLSPAAVRDLVDQAATEAEQSAHRAGVDGRIGGVVSLLLVVLFAAVGLWWRARLRRRDAVLTTQAEARAQFEAMIEHSSDLFFLTGGNNQTQYCSPSAARFFGMSAAEVCAASLDELVHPDDLERASDAFVTVKTSGIVGPLDVRVHHHDGGWRTLEFTGNDLSLASPVQAVAWHTRDVTERRALEEQLERQAFEDPLTGLANRALFRDRLGHALARLSRSKRSIAVLMLDLDGFKAINDSMGHDAGDEALKEIAARIARSARPGDTIARLGGDEFTVLLEGLVDASFAEEVADRILDLVRQPLMIHDMSLRVSASIGVAVSDSSEVTPESLLRDADIAMYNAKTSGRDRRARFQPEMHARANQQLRVAQDLAHALERKELEVYYQPSVALDGERLEGVEALVRWNHREFGLVSPDTFIAVAEQNGLIVPIGRWVLEQACEQAVAWRSEFVTEPGFSMSVNVSGRQLNHESLIPDVRSILQSSGLDPKSLVLEVTESVLMSDINLVVERLKALKQLGVSIAIDDFGTGYSSLAYLRQLPIDILKIDKAFIDAASSGDPGGIAIMRAIIDLSAGLHLKTIAEGIEDMTQAFHLKELGCQSGQGFLYSRPMPPAELWGFFAANALDRDKVTMKR